MTRKSDLTIYHYTEIDKVVIPANTNVRVYRVEDEEGPELHVYELHVYIEETNVVNYIEDRIYDESEISRSIIAP